MWPGRDWKQYLYGLSGWSILEAEVKKARIPVWQGSSSCQITATAVILLSADAKLASVHFLLLLRYLASTHDNLRATSNHFARGIQSHVAQPPDDDPNTDTWSMRSRQLSIPLEASRI